MSNIKNKYAWVIVIGSIITTGLALSFATTIGALFIVPITRDFGIGRAEFAINTTIISLCGCAAQTVTGKLYINQKIKRIQVIALIIFGFTFIARSFTQNIVQQYICSFVAGFLTAPVSLGNTIMINRWFQVKRGTAISIVFAGQSLVAAIASPIIAGLITNTGWRPAYGAMGILILILAVPVAAFVMKENPSDMGMEAYGARAGSAAGGKPKKPEGGAGYTFAEAKVKSFFFLFYGAALFAGFLGQNGVMSQIVPNLTDVYGTAQAVTYVSLGAVTGIVGKLFLGWVSDKFGVRTSLILGYLCFSGFFICQIFLGGIPIFYFITVLFGLVGSIGTVVFTLLTADTFGLKNFSLFFGLNQSISFIGGSFGGLIAAYIYDRTGTYTLTWMISAALALFVMLLYLTANKLSKKHS